jgi:hypothetical protein
MNILQTIDPHYPHWFRWEQSGQDVADALPEERNLPCRADSLFG